MKKKTVHLSVSERVVTCLLLVSFSFRVLCVCCSRSAFVLRPKKIKQINNKERRGVAETSAESEHGHPEVLSQGEGLKTGGGEWWSREDGLHRRGGMVNRPSDRLAQR